MFIYTLPANIFEDIINTIKTFFNMVGQFFVQVVNTVYTLFTVLGSIVSVTNMFAPWIPLLAPFVLVFEISLLVGVLRSI